MKANAGKLKFDRPYDVWIDEALSDDPRIELLQLLPRVPICAVQLSWTHADPADRIIVATAQVHDAPLITADDRIRDARIARCVWE